MTEPDERWRPAAFRLGLRTYQHVVAIVGGFSLIAFLGNLVDVDWHGFLVVMIGAWDEFVRPPVRWFLYYLVEVPLSWAGWRIQVPQWLCDYLAAGVVLFASYVRVVLVEFGWRHVRSVPRSTGAFRRAREVGIRDMLKVFLPSVVLWPAQFVVAIFMAIREALARKWKEAGICVMICSPIIYGALLLAINYLIRD